MKVIRALLAVALLFLVLALAAAAAPPNVEYRDMRTLGMGGAGIATVEGFKAVMYNPARLVHTDFDLDIVNFQVTAGKDITDLIQFFDDNEEIFDNWDDATEEQQDQLLEDMTPFDDNWMGVGAYPQIGIVTNGLALGAYGATRVDFRADKGIIDPRVYMEGVADYVFTGAYATELPADFLPHRLYGGAAFKIIKRYQVEHLKMSASDMEIEQALDTLIEESISGFGLDLGFLYELTANVDMGVKVTDIIGHIDGETPAVKVNLGLGYFAREDLRFAADLNDLFFTKGENLFNKLYFGAEYDLTSWLPLRAGVGQGYPSAGFGLRFGVVEIDGAVYGIEYSDVPGGDGDYSYAFRLKLGL